jgi:murein DD-endopeptidase MepM/ murein hydrolase activator NlpD
MPHGMRAEDAATLRERMLMVPVAGVLPAQLDDTFDTPRDGGRTHRALDILAPRGTPVLAADEGLVIRVHENKLGGRTVYMVDPARRLAYYYAHLDRWADGLAEGQTLARGDVIGYVGTTGNAPRDTPHLHFQVMRLDDPKRYWDGLPLDSRPFFAHDGRPNAPDRQAAR